jgi:4'-phosphopantetheinyl transferase
MGLFWKKEEQQFRIYIWKTDEGVEALLPLSNLSADETARLNSFQSSFRKKEWLCTRIMLSRMMGEGAAIVYDEFGKPHLQPLINQINMINQRPQINQWSISVSHTKDFVAVLVANAPVAGVDIERISPRIDKIATKFLSSAEQERTPLINQRPYYYIIWGAKEVLFKIYGRGELLFKEHLLTEPFALNDSGTLTGNIKKGTVSKTFQISYLFMADLLLTYSTG